MTLREVRDRLKTIQELIEDGRNIVEVGLAFFDLRKDVEDALNNPHKHMFYKKDRMSIAVDFDGVIHSYKSPWTEPYVISDPPNWGAIEWLNEITQEVDVVIFSARCNDQASIDAMINWLSIHGATERTLQKIIFEPGKPSCHWFIDDRAVKFEGSFVDITADQLKKLEPWYYKMAAWKRR